MQGEVMEREATLGVASRSCVTRLRPSINPGPGRKRPPVRDSQCPGRLGPATLIGARDRAARIGGEIGVAVTPIRGRVAVRYLWKAAARSRPEGHVLVFELALVAWAPGDEAARAKDAAQE